MCNASFAEIASPRAHQRIAVSAMPTDGDAFVAALGMSLESWKDVSV
jgi:hypothetical protein